MTSNEITTPTLLIKKKRSPSFENIFSIPVTVATSFIIIVKCYVYSTNAVFINDNWGSLKTNFKVYIDNIFTTIPKMASTHYNFYHNKVH